MLGDMWTHHADGSTLKIWSVQQENDIKIIKNNTMLDARVTELEWFVGTVMWAQDSAGRSASWKEKKAGKYIEDFAQDPLSETKPDWRKLMHDRLKAELEKIMSA